MFINQIIIYVIHCIFPMLRDSSLKIYIAPYKLFEVTLQLRNPTNVTGSPNVVSVKIQLGHFTSGAKGVCSKYEAH